MARRKDLWEVRYLNWNKFSISVLNQSDKTWHMLSTANLVIGGVNFTNDFL